jgi:hypothetical protein
MARSLVIRMNEELPPRPSPVDHKTLSAVFGGCLGQGHNCHDGYTCCPGLSCKLKSGGGTACLP